MNEYPKRIKRLLRELEARVYERELRAELERLAEDFAQWRAGELDTWELDDRIHRYHNGPARDLYNHHSINRPDLSVAHALVTGLLREDEVSAEVQQAIANAIAFYRGRQQEAPE